MFLYSSGLKKHGLIGNITVAAVVGAALIYGGLATGELGGAWIGALAAFLLTLAREIAKDLEDMEGDRSGQIRSLPIVYGKTTAQISVMLIAGIAVILAPVPFTQLGFSGLYLFVIMITSLVLLGAIGILLGKSLVTADYARVSTLLKTAMVVGMAGLVVS